MKIVVWQDELPMEDGARAYELAAEKYGITLEQAKKIGTEGVVKGWQMP